MRGVCSCGAGGTVVRVDSVWLCAGLRKTIRSAYPSCLMCLMYLVVPYVQRNSYDQLPAPRTHGTGQADWLSTGVSALESK